MSARVDLLSPMVAVNIQETLGFVFGGGGGRGRRDWSLLNLVNSGNNIWVNLQDFGYVLMWSRISKSCENNSLFWLDDVKKTKIKNSEMRTTESTIYIKTKLNKAF